MPPRSCPHSQLTDFPLFNLRSYVRWYRGQNERSARVIHPRRGSRSLKLPCSTSTVADSSPRVRAMARYRPVPLVYAPLHTFPTLHLPRRSTVSVPALVHLSIYRPTLAWDIATLPRMQTLTSPTSSGRIRTPRRPELSIVGSHLYRYHRTGVIRLCRPWICRSAGT